MINKNLLIKALSQIKNDVICPDYNNILRAFELCPLSNCKAVFLGQDPYPQRGVATGILFGNKKDTPEDKLSPSLRVIREAAIDYTIPHAGIDFDITLESWAKQGVLMLNSALTTKLNCIGAHTMIWRPFISDFLYNLSRKNPRLIYVLFGEQAQTFTPYISKKSNYIINEKHPAYYARLNERMSSDLFYEVNKYIYGQCGEKIEWFREYI